MDTASKPNESRHFLSFSRKLFLSVILLFLLFAGSVITYQYQREKEYKIELLDLQLQDYNEDLHYRLQETPDSLWSSMLGGYISHTSIKDLRVTVISPKGIVLYDSSKGSEKVDNHHNRPEVLQALRHGKGHDVRRTSETTGIPYFYSATDFGPYLIRSAVPYSVDLINHLSTDRHYLWFTLLVTLAMIFIYYQFTSRLGTAIAKLRQFAKRADKNEPIETDLQSAFPHNELGEISQHIIQIYRRLRETKEALYIEREKLITHLQTSREGLGVFTKEKKEILVNNLFIQYSNLISDSNLETTEEIFSVCEFQKITDFIGKAQKGPLGKEEKRMSLTINKNGRIFIVECIIFQDLSFEISINDISQEEEQNRLKRQLTQNIAHELKTPVSSIQGYLETILSTPDLPQEKMQTFLERCYAQSNRLTRLLRDISVLRQLLAALLHLPQPDGQRHCLCRHPHPRTHQLFPRRRELLLLQLCRYRRRRLARTPEPPLRTLLPRRQGPLAQAGRYRPGTGHRKECRPDSRRNHFRQEQSRRRAGIRVHAGQGEINTSCVTRPQMC